MISYSLRKFFLSLKRVRKDISKNKSDEIKKTQNLFIFCNKLVLSTQKRIFENLMLY